MTYFVAYICGQKINPSPLRTCPKKVGFLRLALRKINTGYSGQLCSAELSHNMWNCANDSNARLHVENIAKCEKQHSWRETLALLSPDVICSPLHKNQIKQRVSCGISPAAWNVFFIFFVCMFVFFSKHCFFCVFFLLLDWFLPLFVYFPAMSAMYHYLNLNVKLVQVFK